MAIVGNVTPAQAIELTQKYFGTWKATGARPTFQYPALSSKPGKAKSVTVKSQTNTQSQVTLKELLPLRRSDGDYVPLGFRFVSYAGDVRFGALPPRVPERDALAQVINELLSNENLAYAAQQAGAAVLGVPGFWEGQAGHPRLGRASDYKRPALIIPYRDRQGMSQACQLRFGGARGKSLYTWLSTSEDRLDKEPRGTSSGSPIHFALRDGKCLSDLPVIITEGALKAEAFIALRPACRAIGEIGVVIIDDCVKLPQIEVVSTEPAKCVCLSRSRTGSWRSFSFTFLSIRASRTR